MSAATAPYVGVTKDSVFPPLQGTALRIYSMRFCPYAQRARLVLEHKQIPYETVNINLRSKPEWFLARNPLGAVPVIEKGDQIVYESTAVCEWLDDVYPHNRLAPQDPYIKAWDRIYLEYFSKIVSLFYNKLRKEETLEEGIVELQSRYKFYEDALAKREGPFWGGASPALLDFYMWPYFERLPALARKDARISVTAANYPRLAEWISHMYELPAVKAIQWDVDSHAHFLTSVDNGNPDFDYGL